MTVAAALSGKPDRDLYPKFEVIFAHASSTCRPLIRMCWRGAAEALGLPSTGALGKAARVASDEDSEDDDEDAPDDDVQWMDEPDD